VDDFDNDGMLDIVSSAWDLTDPLHYFHNNGDGTFTDASRSSGLAAFTGGIDIMQTDYNNDGYLDIYVPGSLAGYVGIRRTAQLPDQEQRRRHLHGCNYRGEDAVVPPLPVGHME
jgi:hypothetical protein